MNLQRTGWLPAVLVAVLTLLALSDASVPLWDTARFSAYVALCLVLPGTLLWRLVSGNRDRLFVEDLVLGTGLAYAVELFVYCACRAVGLPLLTLAWPVAVVAVCLVRRDRRRLWRPPTRRLPVAPAWALAFLMLVPLATLSGLAWTRPLSEEGLRFPYVDEPYQLALVAELRHHFPPYEPFVEGGRVMYHWFAHAHMAASSWATGIEPAMIQQRLTLLPMLAVVVLGVAVLTVRVGAGLWHGVLAAALLTALTGSSVPPVIERVFSVSVLVASPTTAFATALLVPASATVLQLLERDDRWVPGQWAVLVVLVVSLSGAKASALPLLAGGLALVVLLRLVIDRRTLLRPLLMLVVTTSCFALAVPLLYGSRRDLHLEPFGTLENYDLAYGVPGSGVATSATLLVYLLAYQSAALGLIGLVTTGRWRDPRAQFLAGSWLSGLVATLVLESMSWNQAYFIRLTPVFLTVSAAWGVHQLATGRWTTPERGCVAIGLVVGGVTAWVLERRSGAVFAATEDNEVGDLVGAHAISWSVAAAVVAVVLLARRPIGVRRGVAALAGLAAVLGLALPSTGTMLVEATRQPTWEPPASNAGSIGVDGVATARWLRAHSDVDDLIATNVHCRLPLRRQTCDSRVFWLSAYSERHVLVEGWAYTADNLGPDASQDQASCCRPFPDPGLLAENDAAFESPTKAAVDRLRDVHGVRWLVADRRGPVDLAALRRLVPVTHEAGDYVVFELGRSSSMTGT